MVQSTLIELHGISKRYGHVDALREVDLTVHARQIVAIVGDNGAGKSTLVHIISGLERPSEGTILLHGKEVTMDGVSDAVDLGIASAFQQSEFCDNLDVSANIFLGNELRQSGLRDDETMHIRAREVLNRLSSTIRTGQPIEALSGGQRQIVAIARTLLNDPDLIVLDEPTASLSVTQASEILNMITALRSDNRSIIMVCHDLPSVFAVADAIVVMRHGQIVAVHMTADTSYEEIIGEIAGLSKPGTDRRQSAPMPREPRPRVRVP